MEKALFMKQSFKRWIALFLIFCMTSSPLQSLAAVITTDEESSYEETATSSDADDIDFQYDQQPRSEEEVAEIIATYQNALDAYNEAVIATDSNASELKFPTMPKWKDALEETSWIPEDWMQKEFTDEATGSIYWSLYRGITPYGTGPMEVYMGGNGADEPLDIVVNNTGGISTRRWYNESAFGREPAPDYYQVYFNQLEGTGLSLWDGTTELMHGGSFGSLNAGGDGDLPEILNARNWGDIAQPLNVNINIDTEYSVGNTQVVKRSWTGLDIAEGIVIEETITYTKGATFYTRTLKILNNTSKDANNLRLFITADPFFRGYDESYANWHLGNKEAYAYQEMTDGIMSIRGGDNEASTPTRYYSGWYYGEGGASPTAIANLTLGQDLEGATLSNRKDRDSFLALQWGDMDNPMSVPAGGSREIQTIDSFSDPGALQITPAAEKKAPPTATVPFVFTLRNMCIGEADLMDITLTARTENGWTTLVRPSVTQLAGGDGRGITVEVAVPEDAIADEIVYLEANYSVMYQGAIISGTASSQTKILLTKDPTFEYISQVKIMKYDNVTLDAKVSFKNVPELASRNTTIVIRKENGEFTGISKGPISIRSGGVIEGIDVANLEPGRYYLYVTAEGIEYPHNSTYFTVGEEIYAITDMEINPTETTILVEDQLQITATCLPIETNETGVNWESSNTNVAIVDNNGLVRALKPGYVDIKASSTVDINIVRTSRIHVETLVKFETHIGIGVDPQRIQAGGKVERPNLERPGYRLIGWYQDLNFLHEWNFDEEPLTNMVLYALWEESNYLLTYAENGAVEGNVPAYSVHSFGEPIISAPNDGLIKVGYTFDGWNTRPDGTGTDYLADTEFNMPDHDLDLFVKWQRHEPRYTVTYHKGTADGGFPPVDSTGFEIYDQVILMGNTGDLFKAGRYFVGWSTEENGAIIYEPSGQFRIIGDTDLYPQWAGDETEYSLIYDGNTNTGGTALPPQTLGIDTLVIVEDQGSLYKAGHQFTGWATQANGGGISYQPGNEFRLVENVTLYAQWKQVEGEGSKFVVSYRANEATGGMIPINDISYPVDTDVTVAHNTGSLYRAGYDFIGWNTATDGMGTDYAMGSTFRLTESVTLYAKWTLNRTEFLVSYDGNGADGGSVPVGPISYAINSDVTVLGNTDLFKNGMVFEGWNTAANGSGIGYEAGAEFRVQETTVLYAQWKEGIEEFTLTYDGNDADHGQVPAPVTEIINTLVTIEGNTGDLYKAGHRFDGWKDEAGVPYTVGQVILLTRDMTLSANWVADTTTFTVSYDKNGAVNGELPVATTPYPIDSTITVLGNTGGLFMAGKTFEGWTMNSDGSGVVLNADATFRLIGNTVLYAKWADNETKYVVSYDGNTNTGGATLPAQTLAIDTLVVVTGQGSLYKAGHQFKGWATEANGGGTSYQPGNGFRLVGNVTLYAQWEAVTGEEFKFVVTYHANEATGGMIPINDISYPVDTDVMVAHNTGNLYRVTYDFIGWNTQADGMGTDYGMGSTFRLTESVTLYAKWKSNDTAYIVSYDGNGADGGAVPAEPTAYAINRDLTVLGNTNLFKNGMVFDGWNTAANGSGIGYVAGAEFRVQETTVLYAQWKTGTDSFTLTYDDNDADHGQVPAPVTAIINTLVTIEGNTRDLYKAGLRFDGWRDEAGMPYTVGQVILLTRDMTLSANWVADTTTFTVSYDKNGAVNGELPVATTPYPIDSTITVLGNTGGLFMAGKTFEGWTMNADGSGTVLNAGTTFRLIGNTVLYAKWADNETKYAVRYNGNTNTGGIAPLAQTLAIDTLVVVTGQGSLYKAGHQFKGWATEANGGGTSYQPGNGFRLVGNVTLYAQWEAVTGEGFDFVVTYHANEATGGMLPTNAVVAYPVDTDVRVAHNTGNLYRVTYDFIGWNTQADGMGTDYGMGSTFRLTESVTLYAKWKSNDTAYIVSYDGNGADGGAVPAEPTAYAINRDLTVLGNTNLFKNGMVFDGWSTSADGLTGKHYVAGDKFRVQETTVLYAQWKTGTNSFTLTYDGNDADHGQVPAPVTAIINTLVTIEGNTRDLYKAGLRFDGWRDEAGMPYTVGQVILLTRDMTLSANWVADTTTFTVSYDKNGAVNGELPVATTPYPIDSTITVLGNTGGLFMAGKTFEGWTMNSDGSGVVLNADATFRLIGNTVLYAKWADNETKYVVSYDGNTNTGGATLPAQTLAIDTLVVVTGQGSLYKAGHQFKGWATEANGGGTSYQPGNGFRLVGNVTLYAQWEAVTGEEFKFVVTYHANEATGGMIPINDISYPVDTDVMVAHNTGNLYRVTYDFIGWNTQADGMGTDYGMGSTFRLTESVTLYAKWKSNDTAYIVSYDGNGADGGAVPAEPTAYAINRDLTVLGNTNLFKNGMVFDGWNTAANGSGIGYVAGAEFRVQETTVLYAQWKTGTNSFTLTYDGNDADHGQVPAPVTAIINTLVTIEGNTRDLYKAGLRFDGWRDEAGMPHTVGQVILLTRDMTLSANWVADTTTFTVSYDKNGAVNGELPVATTPYPIDSTITVLGNTGGLFMAGKTFEGWTMNADGSGVVLNADATFRLIGNTVLYAKWADNETKYVVSYDGNTNTGGATLPAQTLAIDTLVVVTGQGSLYKAGHQFKGWATEANGGGTSYQPGNGFRLVGNVTLYAQWEAVTGEEFKFVVTYHANEATGGMIPINDISYPVDTDVMVAHNTGNLYRVTYDFIGWNTQADGMGTDYGMGSTFRLTESVTLYAKWKSNDTAYIVSYDGNGADGGAVPAEPTAYAINRDLTVLGNTNLFKNGMVFDGWNTAANGSGIGYVAGAEFRVQETTVLYAQWKTGTDSFTLTYDGNDADHGQVPAPVTAIINTLVTIEGNTRDLYKAGHRFDGWRDEAGMPHSVDQVILLTKNMTLSANWVADTTTFTVSYDKNGAVNGTLPVATTPYPIDSTITVLGNTGNLYMAGKTFKGWTMNANGLGTVLNADDTFRLIGNTILYAKWADSETLYTVIYDKNQATSGDVPVTANYPIDSDIIIQGNTEGLHRVGFNFVGWNTATNGLGETTYQGGESVRLNNSLTLYAKWEKNEDKYTLTYDGNGDGAFIGGNIPVGGTHPANTELTVQGDNEDIYQKSKDLIGWNTEKSGSGEWYYKGDKLILSNNMTLYARWESNPVQYTVSYDGNGADTGSKIPEVKSYGINDRAVVEGNSETVFKAGHNFVGWTLNAAGTGTVYNENNMYRVRSNTKFYAKWELNQKNYTFNYNGNGFTGGSVPTTNATYPANTNITVVGNKESIYKAGYEFKGWTMDAAGAGNIYKEGDTLLLNRNVTLYAKWTVDDTKYTVTYHPDGLTGGTVPVAKAHPINSDVQVLGNTGNLFRSGYNFDGWTNKEGTRDYPVGSKFRLEGDTDLYVKWVKSDEKYTFTYDKNGATGGTIPTNGGTLDVDTIVTVEVHADGLYKAGNIFAGWSTNVAGTGTTYQADAKIRLTANVTLFAKWTPSNVRYTVNYNGNEATGGTPPTGSIHQINSNVVVAGNTNGLYKAGKVFEGWTLSKDGTGTVYNEGNLYRVQDHTTFFAKWGESTEPKPSLTYDKNGGFGTVPVPQTHDINSQVLINGNPNNELYKKGQDLMGWTKNANGSGTLYKEGDTILLTEDTTLYAKWKAHTTKYTLTYNGNGSTGGSTPIAVGGPFEINDFVQIVGNTGNLYKAGSTFKGWALNAAGTGDVYIDGGSLRIRRNTTLYAKWETDAAMYSVTYKVENEDGGNVPTENAVQMSTKVTVKENTGDLFRLGYKLDGWKIEGDTSAKIYRAGDFFILTGNTVLHAIWLQDTNQYKVTYKANGAAGTEPVQESVDASTEITIKGQEALYKAGYTFKEWTTNANGTGTKYAVDATLRLVENMTLYAQWEISTQTYIVTYDGNGKLGGNIPTTGGRFPVDTMVTVAENTGDLYKAGFDFAGWNAEADGSGVDLEANSIIRLTADITLYAKWIPNTSTFNVTYHSNPTGTAVLGGTVPSDTTSYQVNSHVTILANTGVDKLYQVGFVLEGWTENANGSGTVYKDGTTFRITKNTTLYAKWKLSNTTVTLTYDANNLQVDAEKGGNVPSAQAILVNGMATVADKGTLTMKGYNFLGWSTSKSGAVTHVAETSFRISEPTTLYAIWEAFSITIEVTRMGINSSGKTVLIDVLYIAGKPNQLNFNPRDPELPIGWRLNMGQQALRPIGLQTGPELGQGAQNGQIYKFIVNHRPAL